MKSRLHNLRVHQSRAQTISRFDRGKIICVRGAGSHEGIILGKKSKRRQQLLAEHPTCYFCGGLRPSTTVDHVPPRACFPVGYMPEEFEFPACDICNQSSRAEDKMFGFWTMALNFDSTAVTGEDRRRVIQLMTDIAKESPQDVAGLLRAVPVTRVGRIVTPQPVAYALRIPDSFGRAVDLISAKLTHALYFRETKKHLNSAHRFATAAYQPQVGGTEWFTSYIMSLLQKVSVGVRTNIKNYGNRFAYRSGYKEEQDFFFYAAQFGRGAIVWGMVCGPSVTLPTSGPLSTMIWKQGAYGARREASNSRNEGAASAVTLDDASF